MMQRLSNHFALPALIALAGIPAAASAQDIAAEEAVQPGDYVEIGAESGGRDGVTQINIAAGDNNQQANSASVATGAYAINTNTVSQFISHAEGAQTRTYSAKIADGAFAGSNGITSINVAAGSGNQQANLALISTGLEGQVASNAILSQTRASSEPLGLADPSASPEYVAQIDAGAFQDSSGIVQVSLIGGTGNASANVAVLSLEGSAK